MPPLFDGKKGWRVVIVQDESSMKLDGSLPFPWWPGYDYHYGDIIVRRNRFYRCRAAHLSVAVTEEDPPDPKDTEWIRNNRDYWIDITGGGPDIRDLADATGRAGQNVTADIYPNHRIYVNTSDGPVRINLPTPETWSNGDVIEIVDDYKAFSRNPCVLITNGVRLNLGDPNPNDPPVAEVSLETVGVQDYWRFAYYIDQRAVDRTPQPDEQWLYVTSAPAAPQGGGKAVTVQECAPKADGSAWPVKPNTICIVKTGDGPVNLQPVDGAFKDGDTFTIVDHDWTFGKMDADGNTTNAATLLATNNIKYRDTDSDGNFVLDVKGNSSAWPFIYYKGVIHCSAAPISRYWIEVVTALLSNQAAPNPDGSDPTPPAPQGGMLDGAIDGVSAVAGMFNEAPEPDPEPEPEIPAIAPGLVYRIYNKLKISADVEQAEAWTQYDVALGRKKTIAVYLPKVADIPAQSRIRVRVISDSRGLVNVTPDSADQIVGLYGTLNATPKGTPRAVHGQYAMIELESDGIDEWMVV